MNRLYDICITWDMEKIIYSCSAEHIGFIFPKRKWWDFSKKTREARLEVAETFSGKTIRILMRIGEEAGIVGVLGGIPDSYAGEALPYYIQVPPVYREEIRREFIRQSCGKRQFEVLLVVDADGTEFLDMITEVAEDVNYLAVFTNEPKCYETVLDQIAMETGLMGMIFTEWRDFKKYQHQVCEEKNVLVFMGKMDEEYSVEHKKTFFRMPDRSLVLDFQEQEYGQKSIWTKRMKNDYVSMPIFLDNIIKNGYNSLVNEGLQTESIQILRLQQNVYRTDDNNKLSEKRKGIKKWKKRKIF